MQGPRRQTSLFALLLFALVSFASASGDEEIVKEFKKYFKKYKETATRVEAILALEGTESTSVAKVLVPVLKDKDSEVVDAAVRVLGGFETRPPIDYLLLDLEEDKNELVRIGILRSLAAGGYGNIAEAVTVCLTDKAWNVRRRAIQALASTKDVSLGEVLVPLVADRETAVRCAAFDALSGLGSELVLDPSRAALADKDWRVRSSAIAALGTVRHRDSIPPLLERLQVEEGRLREDCAKALEALTGRGFGLRVELWTRFWDSYKDRYEIPTDEELAELRAKQAARKAEYKPQGTTNFVGVDTPSRSVIFVIDVSGSMENHVVEKENFEDGGYPSYSRMDIVKTELARTIENLEPYVKYNIYAFATKVKPWKKKLVPANVLNRSSAMTWTKRLEPLGGSSKEDLARVGLTGSANLEAGKTNTYGALSLALGVTPKGATAGYEQVEVDTIFFLSDGHPTHGDFVDPDDILREIGEANELRKIVIHTIAIGEFQRTFMKQLAERNGGVFVDLGR